MEERSIDPDDHRARALQRVQEARAPRSRWPRVCGRGPAVPRSGQADTDLGRRAL